MITHVWYNHERSPTGWAEWGCNFGYYHVMCSWKLKQQHRHHSVKVLVKVKHIVLYTVCTQNQKDVGEVSKANWHRLETLSGGISLCFITASKCHNTTYRWSAINTMKHFKPTLVCMDLSTHFLYCIRWIWVYSMLWCVVWVNLVI